MARARNIKPGFFMNDVLAELDPVYRLLFIGLWTLADKEGRLEYRPKKIKIQLFPVDDVDVEEGLNQLEKGGFLYTYRAQIVDETWGEKEITVCQICNWHKHQKPHHMENESDLPPPPGQENKFRAKPIYKKQRQRILERDGHECQQCGSTEKLQVDHIVPVSKGGTSDDENLQVLCQQCNLSKLDKIEHESSTNSGQTEEQGPRSTDSGYRIPDSGLSDSGSLNDESGTADAGASDGGETPPDDPRDDPPDKADPVRTVFDHWVYVMGKDPAKTKLTDDRRRKIQARLKEYSVDDCLRAIDGCAASDFHMARSRDNTSTFHNGIDLIFRNGEKLEGFRDKAETPAGRPAGQRNYREGIAADGSF